MREYEVLDKNLDILGFQDLKEDSDPDILQGSAISALVILDRVLKEYKIPIEGIEGILFCTRSYELSIKYDDMESTALSIVVNDKMDRDNFMYIQAYIAFIGFVCTKEEILGKMIKERAFLVYGKEWLIDLVGKDRLPQSFILNYKVDYNNLGEYGE